MNPKEFAGGNQNQVQWSTSTSTLDLGTTVGGRSITITGGLVGVGTGTTMPRPALHSGGDSCAGAGHPATPCAGDLGGTSPTAWNGARQRGHGVPHPSNTSHCRLRHLQQTSAGMHLSRGTLPKLVVTFCGGSQWIHTTLIVVWDWDSAKVSGEMNLECESSCFGLSKMNLGSA